jgi:hypothetical protein
MYIYVCVCIYMCVYIYIYIHTYFLLSQIQILTSVVCWDVTQRRLVKLRRFGTTYRSHLPGSNVLLGQLTLEDGTDVYSRNVGVNQHSLRNIPEVDRNQANRSKAYTLANPDHFLTSIIHKSPLLFLSQLRR